MDQAVTADPVGAVQVRSRIKVYKALLGPESAVYGDHVYLSAMTKVGNNLRRHAPARPRRREQFRFEKWVDFCLQNRL